jgi:serine-type D-Ala-D-Ala carboxypeptidase/endopeptidase (penicillin-binding protein 4)
MHPSMNELFLLLTLALLVSCHSNKNIPRNGKQGLHKAIETSTTFNGLTAFVLVDQATQKVLYEKNADIYFTPASNTKLLTLYTAMKVLGAESSALKYRQTDDGRLLIQGTGHPSLLNPAFSAENNSVFRFLEKNNTAITFCDCNLQDEKYGSGWSWDDYLYYYMSEKSSLPMYANVVTFQKAQHTNGFSCSPPLFKKTTQLTVDSTVQQLRVFRNWDDNNFQISTNSNTAFTRLEKPFRTDAATIAQLLSDTLNREVLPCKHHCEKSDFKTIRSNVPTDDLYRQLLQPSDNFVAEQLLLLCANELFDTLNVERVIEWAQDSLFKHLPQPPIWVDGSGLSRYNMVTPRTLITILNEMYNSCDEERLFNIFPTGGESGTIKDWYGGFEKPYVYAKTGTLRHIHCLSGYIITQKKQRLLFSFMHNNYVGDIRALKREMEKLLQLIYAEY